MANETTADKELFAGVKSISADAVPALMTELLVLVVERDPHVRELEAHFLEQAGFQVAFASDGKEALAQARERIPYILITEVLVPKLDGLALCRLLKQDPRTQDISVLVFSILAANSRALEAGADAFLKKPLAEQRLITTVKSLIKNRPRKASAP
ncbi:response regulator [Xylophilus rhododendri]|uniref:Response regulator n=1 Tax=Xylophilus rhododendri TaxID=2697032 RepID=A0A857IZ57_9BURK|nr:response regulator [Xylophilus rhododendri]QHI96746.1 response regulator [Xylophilus rhododendri]